MRELENKSKFDMELRGFSAKTIKNCLHYCITEKLVRAKEPRKLPIVLPQAEVKAILEATDNLKHRATLITIYVAGLRLSEATKLKITDIDSKNMQIVIREGKGRKDRYSLLSENNLNLLR